LDVAIFGPLKKEWAKEVHEWHMTTEDPLTKHDFAPLLNKVINNNDEFNENSNDEED